jgi:hypothetical protein
MGLYLQIHLFIKEMVVCLYLTTDWNGGNAKGECRGVYVQNMGIGNKERAKRKEKLPFTRARLQGRHYRR